MGLYKLIVTFLNLKYKSRIEQERAPFLIALFLIAFYKLRDVINK